MSVARIHRNPTDATLSPLGNFFIDKNKMAAMRNIYFLYIHLWDSYMYDFGGCALVFIIQEFNKKNIYVIDMVLSCGSQI